MTTTPRLTDDPTATTHTEVAHKPHGWRRWVYATNHKDIGTMYLVLSLTMWFIGGAMAMLIRAELFQPGLQFVDPLFFNSMTTMHGLIMIFGAIMPAFVGLANWMIPLQIGAPDMALPRLNNFSFWILPFAFVILLSTLFVPGGGPSGGWTMYPPLMLQMGASFPMTIFAIHLMGISSILGAINVIVTIMNMRAPGMALLRMPLFVWSWLITAYLLIAVMPVLAGAVTMNLTDHFFGTTFLLRGRRRRSGDVSAHLLVLRAPGGVHHDPAGIRHRLRDHPHVLAQADLRLRVHGVRPRLHRFPVLYRLGASHVHGGHAARRAALLHAFDHADLDSDRREDLQLDRDDVEGLADLRAADAVCDRVPVPVLDWRLFRPDGRDRAGRLPVSRHLLRRGAFPLRARDRLALRHQGAVYHWLPKWTGHMYDMTLAKWHFWLSAIFVNVLFFPQHFLGLAGMPRRIPDYATQFTDWNMVSSIGGFVFGVSQILFAYIIWKCVRSGSAPRDSVWEGARGLEWELSSPPPYHSWESPPADAVIARGAAH